MIITLDKIFKIDVDFANVYIISKSIKNFNKKVLINTSTRVFDGEKYDTLYIIEPKVSYLIPFERQSKNNATYIVENLIGETGIILQILNDYILLYNTNENLVFLNKGIEICNIKASPGKSVGSAVPS